LETAASQNFASEQELLLEIVQQLVDNEQIKVNGGRVWELDVEKKGYKLIYQTGTTIILPEDFYLLIQDNEIFNKISTDRTVLADETNKSLIEKGILKYSASGVGPKIPVDGLKFYKYMIALNSDVIGEELYYTLNIVATVLTSKLREKWLSKSQYYLKAGLDEAQKLQRSILPEHELNFHQYDIFGVTIPAEILGGDFFDYLKIGDHDDRLGIVVGDAASKGLAAAAEAMYISGAVRMASTFQIKISETMNRINKLVNKIFSDDRFTSLFYGEILNDKRGLFLYSNAGHNPPIFISKNTKNVTYLTGTGPLLGPAPNSKFETDSLNFESGDILVIYSDGITEAANEEFQFYEESRLEKTITNVMHKSPKEIALHILDDVKSFSTAKSKYQDDKTVVVVKRK
jgi:serine phosphatase RsbU (regulator of sigma subunit)